MQTGDKTQANGKIRLLLLLPVGKGGGWKWRHGRLG